MYEYLEYLSYIKFFPLSYLTKRFTRQDACFPACLLKAVTSSFPYGKHQMADFSSSDYSNFWWSEANIFFSSLKCINISPLQWNLFPDFYWVLIWMQRSPLQVSLPGAPSRWESDTNCLEKQPLCNRYN